MTVRVDRSRLARAEPVTSAEDLIEALELPADAFGATPNLRERVLRCSAVAA